MTTMTETVSSRLVLDVGTCPGCGKPLSISEAYDPWEYLYGGVTLLVECRACWSEASQRELEIVTSWYQAQNQ